MRAQNSTKTVDNASQSVKLLVFRFVGKGGAAVRLSMNTRYAVIHASFWGAYGSLWAFIALVLEYNGFASAQVGVVTSCATLLSVFLSPAVSSFLDARPGLENRHGAMALLTLAAALCLLVWLVPLPRPFVLGVCFALIGAFLSSTPPFQNAMAMDANRCGIPVVYGFCRGVGSVSYAAAVLLLGFVLERHAPTLLLPIFAALTACGLLAMSGFRLPERPDEAADRPAEHRSIAAVLRSHPRFARTLLGCMFFLLTHTISNTYMNALVGKAGGTASAVGTSLAISAVLELPAMTLVSRLQKRFSPGFFLRFAAGAEVVKFLIFYLARSMPLIYLGHCMQFFQFAVYAPATSPLRRRERLPRTRPAQGTVAHLCRRQRTWRRAGQSLLGGRLDRSGIQAALLLGTVSAAASLLTFCLSTREGSRGEKRRTAHRPCGILSFFMASAARRRSHRSAAPRSRRPQRSAHARRCRASRARAPATPPSAAARCRDRRRRAD